MVSAMSSIASRRTASVADVRSGPGDGGASTVDGRHGGEGYVADPHSPWQRGINENTNGLLRQSLPKGPDLSLYSQAELDAIAWTRHTRPRTSLGFKGPAELFPPDAFDFRQHQAALFALGH